MDKRRPYLAGNEIEEFKKWKVKGMPYYYHTEREYSKNLDWYRRRFRSFDSVCDFCCFETNDDFRSFACEGSVWLTHFVSLGVITMEHGEKIDFVCDELTDIIQNVRFLEFRDDMSREDYDQLKQDLRKLREYYEIE